MAQGSKEKYASKQKRKRKATRSVVSVKRKPKGAHLVARFPKGEFDGESVKCPWHGSHFAVEDDSVIYGPTSFAQPCFETRCAPARSKFAPDNNCGACA
jgi:nitrite reductase/ring-hydroxylating ferredoxin subunit